MENGMRSLKEKEVIVDIDSNKSQVDNETTPGNRREKRLLNYDGSGEGEASVKSEGISGGSFENPPEATLDMLIGKNIEEQQRLIEKGHEKERRKHGKVKKAAKPPRPPNGPTLSATDLLLIDEIARMTMKKRERMERIKAAKMMQAARGSSSQQGSLSSTNGSTIFAMAVTVLFLLILIFQGIVTNSSSGLSPSAAPQPSPMSPIQFYKTAFSDDGAAQGFVPSKSSEETRKERTRRVTINRQF